jgi:hypothetical protein
MKNNKSKSVCEKTHWGVFSVTRYPGKEKVYRIECASQLNDGSYEESISAYELGVDDLKALKTVIDRALKIK